jgi:hypothetical protein
MVKNSKPVYKLNNFRTRQLNLTFNTQIDRSYQDLLAYKFSRPNSITLPSYVTSNFDFRLNDVYSPACEGLIGWVSLLTIPCWIALVMRFPMVYWLSVEDILFSSYSCPKTHLFTKSAARHRGMTWNSLRNRSTCFQMTYSDVLKPFRVLNYRYDLFKEFSSSPEPPPPPLGH